MATTLILGPSSTELLQIFLVKVVSIRFKGQIFEDLAHDFLAKGGVFKKMRNLLTGDQKEHMVLLCGKHVFFFYL